MWLRFGNREALWMDKELVFSEKMVSPMGFNSAQGKRE
jgi:hypothetical protein